MLATKATEPPRVQREIHMKILITGGAGFIGYNYAMHRMTMGDEVKIYDDCSRLRSAHRMTKLVGLNKAIIVHSMYNDNYDAIIHLAGQTAVTRSFDDPLADFNNNALLTVRLLERIRVKGPPFPIMIFASTNKVYGPSPNIGSDSSGIPFPVDEYCPINLTTPYGLSKGIADLYMQDYARHFSIPTIILRMSCIYGPHQTGEEDQGWVSHFANKISRGEQITIFGDGMQVRDVLYIDDLMRLYDRLLEIYITSGHVFNVGGGKDFSVGIQSAAALLSQIMGKDANIVYSPRRTDDQDYYVSNISRVSAHTGWFPTTPPQEGFRRLAEWIGEAEEQF